MNKSDRLVCILITALLLSSAIFSCRTEDLSPPPGGGGNVPNGTPKGSGTLSFDYSGRESGTLSFSGNGYWPPSGTGVAAAVDSTGQRLQIVAYKQLTTAKAGQSEGAHFGFVLIDLFDVSGLTAITYTTVNSEMFLQVGLDVDTSHADSLAFQANSGSVTIDTKTSSQISGTFTLTAVRHSDGATLTIPNGAFSVKYVTGTVLNEDRSSTGIGGQVTLSPFGPFPLPTILNINGILGVSDVITNSSGSVVESKTAFAAFYQSSANTSATIYGGSVLINGSELDTVRNNRNIVYLLPSKYQPSATLNLSFNGSSSASFNVFGGTVIPPFSINVTAPGPSTITSPAQNAQVSRARNFTIQWTSPSTVDSILLIVSDQGGHSVTRQGLQNTGTYTISASELSRFLSGTGTIYLVKYRYTTNSAAGQKFAAVAEVFNQRRINFY